MDLVKEIYQLTQGFPVDERFGLVSQMRRSSISIPSNIAEGFRRNANKEFARFVSISMGSGAELETQIEIAMRLGYLSEEKGMIVLSEAEEVMRILNAFRSSLLSS